MTIITSSGDVIEIHPESENSVYISFDNRLGEQSWVILPVKEAMAVTHELCNAMSEASKLNSDQEAQVSDTTDGEDGTKS